jgi:hypothetical protein
MIFASLMPMKSTRLFALLFCLLPLCTIAQNDTVPRLVAGKFDWVAFKQRIKAPAFQQKDLTGYIMRKDSLTDMLIQEESATWMNDWHFFDVNADRQLDGVYSGATKAKGMYSYFVMGDSNLTYPVRLKTQGYVHGFDPGKDGIDIVTRTDAHAKEYLHIISAYFYRYATKKATLTWQLQMVSTTEVPETRSPEALTLRLSTQLRTSPRLVNDPAIDYNQDDKPDGLGNIIATLDHGMKTFRLAETETAGKAWSFVLVFDTPAGKHMFKPITPAPGQPPVRMAYAGWVLTEALEE